MLSALCPLCVLYVLVRRRLGLAYISGNSYFFWKFEGLAESRLPEISLEIWGLGEKSWGEI